MLIYLVDRSGSLMTQACMQSTIASSVKNYTRIRRVLFQRMNRQTINILWMVC